ncbi:alpha/beta hydrolase [Nocardioides stalactiti]|uniref:alpha/beta hydrolase n=1 Tax=Nocardioides stalactiti TaxID=2755356 RepID=UPI0028A6E781|nr:alpha/beta fold hydrolase [Nocardioides stalactiti]
MHVPDRPRGAVLVLHGGGSRGSQVPVSPTQLSVLRMIPIARRIARAAPDELAVYRLLNSVRGWDTHHTPVRDVEWAMGELRTAHGGRPTCLVGHSLGGRAALFAGHLPDVVSVAALNPWVYPDDDPDLRGRQVLVVHGTADRIADRQRAVSVARYVARHTRIGFVTVPGGKHAMLRHRDVYDGFAAQFAVGTLLGTEQAGPVGAVLGGAQWVDA